MQFKTTRNKVGLFSAVLAVVALGTSCGSPLGNKVNPKDANSRQQLMDTLKVYEDSQSTVVMDKTSLSFEVNNFSAKGNAAIYKEVGQTGSSVYERKVINNVGLSIDNQKTISTTIPNYLLRDLSESAGRTSDASYQKGLEFGFDVSSSEYLLGITGVNNEIKKTVSIPSSYSIVSEDKTYNYDVVFINMQAFEDAHLSEDQKQFESLDFSDSKIVTINGTSKAKNNVTFKYLFFTNGQRWKFKNDGGFIPQGESTGYPYFYSKKDAIYLTKAASNLDESSDKEIKTGSDDYKNFINHIQQHGCTVQASNSNNALQAGTSSGAKNTVDIYSFSYILSFPLVSILPDVLYGDKIFGDYYQNMETNFYLQNAKNDAKNVNFTVGISDLMKFADEIGTKFGSSVSSMLPVQGNGSVYVTCKTDENGYVSYINFQLKGNDIKVALGKGLHDKDPLTSNVSKNASYENSEEEGEKEASSFEVLKTLLMYYFQGYMSGGAKFEGEVNIDVTLDVSREASSYSTANFVTDDYSNEKYTLLPQKLSNGFEVPSFEELIQSLGSKGGLMSSKIIRAENPSYLFDGQNYECLIIPKEVSYKSGKYYEIDESKCGISVNGIKVSNQTPTNSMDYNYHYMTAVDYTTEEPDPSSGSLPKTIKAYKICIGRNYLNHIKSTLGDDALFQFKFGIKE